MQRTLWVVILLTLIAVIGLLAGYRREFLPERSHFERGRRVAVLAGCFSCHPQPGDVGAPNPKLGRDGSGMAATRENTPSFFTEAYSPDVLRQWIVHGVSDRKKASQAYMESREREALKMPAYGSRLDDEEIDRLMLFIEVMHRREAAKRSAVEAAFEQGERLARQLACFDCHGELGQGGVANPGSFKGYIPGFFGWDFRILTDHGDREAVRQWIADGVSQTFLNRGFLGLRPAKKFIERQAIQMPAYGAMLTDEELETLVDYILALQALGPLDAEGLARYREQFGGIEIKDEVIHTTADGRELLVIHGDQFDVVVKYAKWLAHIGDKAYVLLLAANHWLNIGRRRMGFSYWSLSAYMKQRAKRAVEFIGRFQLALSEEARRRDLDGVVCGHIHTAEFKDMNGLIYCNDGDWVESCTALVEHETGELEILWWAEEATRATVVPIGDRAAA